MDSTRPSAREKCYTWPDTLVATTSRRPLLLVLAAALAVVAIVAFVAWPRDEKAPARRAGDSPPQAATAPEVVEARHVVSPGAPPAKPEVPAEPVASAFQPESPPVDLFAAPSIELIDTGHRIVSEGERLKVYKSKEIYEYGKAHPDDARPLLILALDAMNRGWHALAADHYIHAARRDPRAMDDPRMLRDLVAIAGGQYDSDDAEKGLVELFGPRALPAIRKAIGEASAAGDSARVERLLRLSNRLE